jgi:hypothetical protein
MKAIRILFVASLFLITGCTAVDEAAPKAVPEAPRVVEEILAAYGEDVLKAKPDIQKLLNSTQKIDGDISVLMLAGKVDEANALRSDLRQNTRDLNLIVSRLEQERPSNVKLPENVAEALLDYSAENEAAQMMAEERFAVFAASYDIETASGKDLSMGEKAVLDSMLEDLVCMNVRSIADTGEPLQKQDYIVYFVGKSIRQALPVEETEFMDGIDRIMNFSSLISNSEAYKKEFYLSRVEAGCQQLLGPG